MNALLQPASGKVRIFDKIVIGGKKNRNINSVRKKVGLVFQFPEYQLFEETVEKDIMFGPLNFGAGKEEASIKARKALEMVGLDNSFLGRSPFNLSGGQMRRVAIAGILAMEPEVLILDEPTAGLDPRGQKEMMNIFRDLHNVFRKTIILVTHNMDHVIGYAERAIVLNKGKIVYDGKPLELFSKMNIINEYGLDLPEIIKISRDIENKLNISLPKNINSVDELALALLRVFRRCEDV